MAKFTIKQRVSYNQGLFKAGGLTGARAKGYLQGVKDAQTASRIAARNRAKKLEAEANEGKKK